MAHARSLDFRAFVKRLTGGTIRRMGSIAPGAVALMLAGCSPQSAPAPVEDSLTSGRITVVSATEASGLMARERDAFQSLYPKAVVEVAEGSCRHAIGELFAARCDLAVITRELAVDERAAAVRGRLELEGYRFARDAVVMVVHPGNPVENLTIDEVRLIFGGEAASWEAFGGRDRRIVPVVQPVASDMTEVFVQQVMGGLEIRARSRVAGSDSEVVAAVAAEPGAIGFVSLAWAERGARALSIASLRGLPYWKPDLEPVYRGQYPLTRFFNLYVRAAGAKLANGLITFVTSIDGQRLVQQAGYVPTAVPVRFVRRSLLLGTH